MQLFVQVTYRTNTVQLPAFNKDQGKKLAAAITRNSKFDPDFVAATLGTMKTNLMSGQTYFEDIDTPFACSPSTETYWSM